MRGSWLTTRRHSTPTPPPTLPRVPKIPAYLSAFVFPDQFRRHLETTGSTRDYLGPVGVPSVKWDIDRENIDIALRDMRRLASFLTDRFRLDDDDLMVGFSGSKGFHIELPVGWMVEPTPDANITCRLFAELRRERDRRRHRLRHL